jgi:hypothetical protein
VTVQQAPHTVRTCNARVRTAEKLGKPSSPVAIIPVPPPGGATQQSGQIAPQCLRSADSCLHARESGQPAGAFVHGRNDSAPRKACPQLADAVWQRREKGAAC